MSEQYTDLRTSRDMLPPPPAPSAPKKRWTLGKAVGLAVFSLIVIGAIGSAIDANETTTVDPVPDSAITADLPEPDWDAGIALNEQVLAEIEQVTPTSAVSQDLLHLERAADLLDQEALLFDGTTYAHIAPYLRSAADHTRQAAAIEEQGDFVGFEEEMDLAADDIEMVASLVDE